MEKKDQALQIINSLVRELKEAKKLIQELNVKIYRLEHPKIKFENPKSGLIDRIIDDARHAMTKNVERIAKEIENAKQKQSKG